MYAIIDGGNVPSGKVKVSGAKNSATRLLAASLLTDGTVELSNFPTRLIDVQHKVDFAEKLGAVIELDHVTETARISASGINSPLLSRDDYDVPIRTTYLLAAAQLLRTGSARIPYPGGCPIGGGAAGARGYDLHIMVWEQLGATVREEADHIHISAAHGLNGGEIKFPISTVGGTENALISASIAKGITNISNAYITPEVKDLIKLLRAMGCDIAVSGSSHIIVRGDGHPLSGAHMEVMSDRIEALTWLVYGILSAGNFTIERVPFDAMEVPLIHLEHAGVDLLRSSSAIHVTPDCLTSGTVQPFELACGSFPGVISDMQAFFVLLGLAGAGTSRIYDYRYPERIAFVDELARLIVGENLQAERGKITVNGPAQFRSGIANSTDLRGSMAVVMAALCATGQSRIDNVQMALRGYNDLDVKLRNLGATIEIFSDQETTVQSGSTTKHEH